MREPRAARPVGARLSDPSLHIHAYFAAATWQPLHFCLCFCCPRRALGCKCNTSHMRLKFYTHFTSFLQPTLQPVLKHLYLTFTAIVTHILALRQLRICGRGEPDSARPALSSLRQSCFERLAGQFDRNFVACGAPNGDCAGSRLVRRASRGGHMQARCAGKVD